MTTEKRNNQAIQLQESREKLRILKWIEENKLKNNKGKPIEFDNHGFLWDYLIDPAKRIVVQKCTQIGVSFVSLLKILFRGDSDNLSIIYTFPTSGDVKDFVISKFDPVIQSSLLKNKVEKDPFSRRAVYSTVLKRIGGSHFFFRSSWVEHSAQSIDADILCVDELDFQKPDIRAMYEERLEGSASKDIIYWLGCPTLPNWGINEIYERSDQREWHIQCPHCQKLQTLSFPENISFKKVSFICRFCREDLPDEARKKGVWISKFPGREIHGYYFNRLMAPWISAARILKSYHKDKIKHFHNFTLGKPFLETMLQFRREDFQKTVLSWEQSVDIKAEKLVCGIDQGSHFHFITGQVGKNGAIVTDASRIESGKELEDRLDSLKPDLIVMDMFPDQHYARKVQDRYGLSRVALVNQRTYVNPEMLHKWMDYQRVRGIINLERTESLDRMFDILRSQGVSFLQSVANLEEVFLHIQNLVPQYQDRFGRRKKIYAKIGQDDYAHALNYFLTGREILYPPDVQKQSFLIPSFRLPTDLVPGSPEWLKEDFERRTRKISVDEGTILIPPKQF